MEEKGDEGKPTEKTSAAWPTEAQAALKELDKFSAQSLQALEAKIGERRKVVFAKIESLKAKAGADLVTEMDKKLTKLKTQSASELIAHPGWSPSPMQDRLIGEWSFPGNKYYYTLERDGGLFRDGKRHGVWYWIDSELGVLAADVWGGEFVDMLHLAPDSKDEVDAINNRGAEIRLTRKSDATISETHYKFVLAQAGYYEAKLWQEQKAAVARKRIETAATLRAQAKGQPDTVVTVLLAEAERLEHAPHVLREKAERVAGKWKAADGKIWEFLPNGLIRRNDHPIDGLWKWAKGRNWNTILVRTTSGKPGEERSTDIFFARKSSTEPNVLRVAGLGGNPGDFHRE